MTDVSEEDAGFRVECRPQIADRGEGWRENEEEDKLGFNIKKR